MGLPLRGLRHSMVSLPQNRQPNFGLTAPFFELATRRRWENLAQLYHVCTVLWLACLWRFARNRGVLAAKRKNPGTTAQIKFTPLYGELAAEFRHRSVGGLPLRGQSAANVSAEVACR